MEFFVLGLPGRAGLDLGLGLSSRRRLPGRALVPTSISTRTIAPSVRDSAGFPYRSGTLLQRADGPECLPTDHCGGQPH